MVGFLVVGRVPHAVTEKQATIPFTFTDPLLHLERVPDRKNSYSCGTWSADLSWSPPVSVSNTKIKATSKQWEHRLIPGIFRPWWHSPRELSSCKQGSSIDSSLKGIAATLPSDLFSMSFVAVFFFGGGGGEHLFLMSRRRSRGGLVEDGKPNNRTMKYYQFSVRGW